MTESTESHLTLWTWAKRFLDNLLAGVENRVELFATELHDEKRRLVEAALLVAAVAAMGMATLSVLTITLILLFWEAGIIVGLFGLCAIYLAATAAAVFALRKKLTSPTPLSATLARLKNDRSTLRIQGR